MRLLDLFCGAGGAAEGYRRAGFTVVGVDKEDQPNFKAGDFCQADVFDRPLRLEAFDAVHASPPCQMFSAYRRARPERDGYVNLIPETRKMLREWGGPYVIENVPGAPLENPVQLCGTGFGLDVQRHRLFETNFPLMGVPCSHGRNAARFDRGSRHIRPNDRRTVAVGEWRIPLEVQQKAMGIDWMTVPELSQAIPPAYTEHIGTYLMAHLNRRKLLSFEPAPLSSLRIGLVCHNEEIADDPTG